LWESAQHSNLSADYQAYLEAFPNGVFAQMAKNRVANLATAASQPPVQAPQPALVPLAAEVPQKVAVAEPAASPEAVSPARDWKAEIGTADSEKALSLTAGDQKEIQQRLIALELYKGRETGALDAPTRSAMVEWQKSRGVGATSFLGPLQLAELRAESESEYQRTLQKSESCDSLGFSKRMIRS
jgi:hypothetical protein